MIYELFFKFRKYCNCIYSKIVNINYMNIIHEWIDEYVDGHRISIFY